MAKNTICLWYDKDAEAAARFYAKTFPDSAVGAVHRAPSDYPSGKAGGRFRRHWFDPAAGRSGGAHAPIE
jgi:predicted 3-demethylubiquinone-9 3-methyltransferase (glyoxalase superfamily)